jgi:very-short-patch-repair endonuclease
VAVRKKTDATYSKARSLRRNQTEAESLLWRCLQSKQINGVKFRRQQPIGPYIVDFVSFQQKLIIEIDGGQHSYKSETISDEERTAELQKRGYKVIRFWNNEILQNPESVVENIIENLGDLRTSP